MIACRRGPRSNVSETKGTEKVNSVSQCFATCEDGRFAYRAGGTEQVLGAVRRACVALRKRGREDIDDESDAP